MSFNLANALGSVPHSFWASFDFRHTSLVKNYFQDIQPCFTTSDFTTTRLETMLGCTIIRASKLGSGWPAAGIWNLSTTHQGLHGRDMTTMTTTVPCTRRLLGKFQENITGTRIKIKPSKSRNVSIVKISKESNSNGVREANQKSWKMVWLETKGQDEVQETIKDLEDLCCLANWKSGVWFGLLPRLMWPLSMFQHHLDYNIIVLCIWKLPFISVWTSIRKLHSFL